MEKKDQRNIIITLTITLASAVFPSPSDLSAPWFVGYVRKSGEIWSNSPCTPINSGSRVVLELPPQERRLHV